MDKRVGGKRKSPEVRKIEIYNAIAEQTEGKKGYGSVTSIARAIGMTPSTHLYDLCKQMVTDNEIDVMVNEDQKPIYKFYFSTRRQQDLYEVCKLPWTCKLYITFSVNACTDGDGRKCPVFFLYNKREETQ